MLPTIVIITLGTLAVVGFGWLMVVYDPGSKVRRDMWDKYLRRDTNANSISN